MHFIPVKAKLNFQQPLVWHDSTEILICLFGAQEIFLINVNAENSGAA